MIRQTQIDTVEVDKDIYLLYDLGYITSLLWASIALMSHE